MLKYVPKTHKICDVLRILYNLLTTTFSYFLTIIFVTFFKQSLFKSPIHNGKCVNSYLYLSCRVRFCGKFQLFFQHTQT